MINDELALFLVEELLVSFSSAFDDEGSVLAPAPEEIKGDEVVPEAAAVTVVGLFAAAEDDLEVEVVAAECQFVSSCDTKWRNRSRY